MQGISSLAPIRGEPQLLAEAAELRALPQFEEAMQRYTRGIVAFRQTTRPYGKLIANEDRFRIINFFFPLWAASLAEGGSGALTYSTLHAVCRRGEVTHRVLKNTLAMAVHLGFLTRTPNPTDGRSKLYAPTELMVRFPYLWLEPATRALDELMPGSTFTSRLLNDPDLLVHFFLSAGREFDSGVQPARLVSEFMRFSGRKEGGTLLAMALLLSEMEGAPMPSRSEVASSFGLTKSQVNQLVATGIEMGFLTTHKGVAHPTEALREGHRAWVSVALAFLRHHLRPERHQTNVVPSKGRP